jgi:hypothetical protein
MSRSVEMQSGGYMTITNPGGCQDCLQETVSGAIVFYFRVFAIKYVPSCTLCNTFIKNYGVPELLYLTFN